MPLIPMLATLFHKALMLQGEIWCQLTQGLYPFPSYSMRCKVKYLEFRDQIIHKWKILKMLLPNVAQELEIYKTFAFDLKNICCFVLMVALWEVVVHDGSIYFTKGTIAEN